MTRMLDKIVRRSDAIDKESLCIQAGQRVRPPLSSPPFIILKHTAIAAGLVPPPNPPPPLLLRQPS